MAKNKKQDDALDSVDLNNETLDEVKTPEVITPKPLVLKYDLDQAFRLYQKENELAKNWTKEAVVVFCKKRLPDKSAPLNDWFRVFSQY